MSDWTREDRYSCPHCEDTGYLHKLNEDGSRWATPCVCLLRRRLQVADDPKQIARLERDVETTERRVHLGELLPPRRVMR